MLPKLKILGLAFRLAKPVTDIVYLTNYCLVKPYASMPKPYSGKHTSNQSGAVAIIIAIAIPILIGIAGLALDLGKLFITKTELQNAADACALSAANELTGVTNQFELAEAAGKLVGNLNKAYFQSSANNISSVTFSETLGGSYFPSGSATADTKFIKCTATKSNIANFLIQVLNVMPGVKVEAQQSVAASAVATLTPTGNSCSLLPIGICKTGITNTTPKGTWVSGVVSAGNGLTGNFRWVDFDPTKPTPGCTGTGASELSCILSGNNTCITPPTAGSDVSGPGQVSSARDDYNTRFGLKHGSANGVADSTGFSYHPYNCTSKFDAYNTACNGNNQTSPSYKSEQSVNAIYQDVSPQFNGSITGIKLTGGTSKVDLTSGTSVRRLMVAPVIDCTTMKISSSSPKYACVLLLHPMETQGSNSFTMWLEYLGDAGKSSACSSRLAGSPNSTGPVVSALVQ